MVRAILMAVMPLDHQAHSIYISLAALENFEASLARTSVSCRQLSLLATPHPQEVLGGEQRLQGSVAKVMRSRLRCSVTTFTSATPSASDR